MIGFNHAAAGALIAITLPPQYVPVVALLSHFVMDALPHFGNSDTFKPYTKAFKWLLLIDAVMCCMVLGFSWWLFPQHWLIIAVGTFFATLPDFLWLLDGKVKWLKKYFTFAKRIQWAETPEGWMYELLYFSLMFIAIVALI